MKHIWYIKILNVWNKDTKTFEIGDGYVVDDYKDYPKNYVYDSPNIDKSDISDYKTTKDLERDLHYNSVPTYYIYEDERTAKVRLKSEIVLERKRISHIIEKWKRYDEELANKLFNI